MAVGSRTILIGGPEGSVPWVGVAVMWAVAALVSGAATLLPAEPPFRQRAARVGGKVGPISALTSILDNPSPAYP